MAKGKEEEGGVLQQIGESFVEAVQGAILIGMGVPIVVAEALEGALATKPDEPPPAEKKTTSS